MADFISARVMLAMLGVLMAFGGTILFFYGAFMTMYIVRPSYRFVSPPIAWISMLFAGAIAIFVAALAIFFACRPRPYRLELLFKLCILVLVLKITAVIVTREVTTEDKIAKEVNRMFNDTPRFAIVQMELKCCGLNNYFDYPKGMIKINKYTKLEASIPGEAQRPKYEVKFFKLVLPPISCYGKKMYNFNKPHDITEAVTYLNHDLDHGFYPYKLNDKMLKYYGYEKNTGQNVYACGEKDVWRNTKEPINVYTPDVIYPDEHFKDLIYMMRSNYTMLCKAFSAFPKSFNPSGTGNGPDLRPTYQRGCKKIILDEVATFRSQLISTLATVINEITVAITAIIYAKSLRRREREEQEEERRQIKL